MRLLLFALLLLASVARAAVPDFAEVRAGYRSSYAEMLDRNGHFLHARRLDASINRLDWVALEDVSPALREAVVFAEDRDFAAHRGIDWGATARAFLQFLKGDKSRGASTITMQLAGLLEPGLGWRRGGRSVGQKWRQMQAARALEARWSKAEILEAWLNLLVFRGDLQGVGAASRALFGKSPAGLGRTESLLLAALLPAPSASPARVVRRACTLIQAGFINADCQSVRDLALATLDRRLAPYPENPALDSLAVQLLRTPGEKRRTTLDAALQSQAIEALTTQLAQLRERNVNAGAVLVLDNETGAVRAYVANAGLVPSARFVDGIQALRQAGSTLKPLLYAQAFDQRLLTAASVLEDAPLSLATPSGLYSPQNYDKDFKGPVSARMALASSLNVPAVRVLNLVGVEAFWLGLRRLGFTSLTEAPEFYGYSLALGSADVSLEMLANAYRTLGNGGRFSALHFTDAPPAPAAAVISEGAAFIVTDILADRGARALTFGLDNPLALPFPAAVKTGTSKDMRDNWCIGFSSRHTVAVWVGNLDGAPMREVSGTAGAAPVWASVMQVAEGDRFRFGEDAPVPAELRRQQVVFAGLAESPRGEWFLSGTEMATVTYVPGNANRIVYPVNETVVALDPDIPGRNQRLRFRAETLRRQLDWWLDGRRLGPALDHDWAPVAGFHRLELRDATGQALDAVVFTVRGRALPR
ncbi:MAG: pbpC [Moraxellaceae bacterium]|jgi:penicillin-binding protein 1C|nr:pbpC [Moraxellaceae bacterium]